MENAATARLTLARARVAEIKSQLEDAIREEHRAEGALMAVREMTAEPRRSLEAPAE